MSEQEKAKRVNELTVEELDKAILDLLAFYEFTFFGERGVEESLGLCYALELQACSLGLVGDCLYEDVEEYNSADMMQQFAEALNKRAEENKNINAVHWKYISDSFPY